MVHRHLVIGFFVGIVAMFCGCKKDEEVKPTPVPTPAPAPPPVVVVPEDSVGTLVFNFRLLANGLRLQPQTTYTNASQDSFTVTKFNYYVSNLKLKLGDTTWYEVPESYYLIEHLPGKESFTITGVPKGTYVGIEFMIGVDSLHNVSGAQTGALDPSHNMFWDWNSGYIFFKMEGGFNTLSQPQWGDYAIHVGGFEAGNNCIQHCSFPIAQEFLLKGGRTTTVNYDVRVDEVFVNPKYIDFDYYYAHIGNKTIFKAISDNYRDMFEIESIEMP